MDHFGIGNALRGMLLNYSYSARQTGRTTSLVESVREGDQVVFCDPREAKRVKNLLAERGVIDVKIRVVSPDDPNIISTLRHAEGRTIFDHMWVEEFYRHRIEQAINNLDYLQGMLSKATPRPPTDYARRQAADWR